MALPGTDTQGQTPDGIDAVDSVVVGAGWAGLTAALQLARAGHSVRLLDAAPQAGGRARSLQLDWDHPQHGPTTLTVDNGQHLLIGAYAETLRLLTSLGAAGQRQLERRPMHFENSDGLRIARHRLAADAPGESGTPLLGALLEPLTPLLALLGAQGLPLACRWALIRTLVGARRNHWLPPRSVLTVADWYRASRQPAALIHAFWHPLVISTLNTPAESACAATFLRVLRDSLGASPAATDYLLPRASLGEFFAAPVIGALQQLGGRLVLRRDVRRIERGQQRRYRLGMAVRGADERLAIEADQIVLATPPAAAARLLRTMVAHPVIAELERFDYLPITTAWLGWPLPSAGDGAVSRPRSSRLAGGQPVVLSLPCDPGAGSFAHWLFDRGQHGPWWVGSLVISDSREARALGATGGESALAEALTRQLTDATGLPAPAQISLIHEKRATIACTPQRPTLRADSLMPELAGIALAGDYAWPDYPATLEGAVRSGLAAAALFTNPPPQP